MSDLSLLSLPLDVLGNVLKRLSVPDLRNVMLTCKILNEIVVNDSSIWRSISQERLILNNSADSSQTNTFSWYHRCRISHNWCKGIYYSKIVLYHRVNYMPWISFYNSQALFLALGEELFCYPTDRKGFPNCKEISWRLQVPVVKRFDVRTNDISRFLIKDNFIVCGNRDGCASVYKMDSYNRRPVLQNHVRDCHEEGQVEVSAVELLNAKHSPCIITASAASPVLRYWCVRSDYNINGVEPDSTHIKEFHLGYDVGVRCMTLNKDENILAVGLNGNSKPLLVEVTTNKLFMASEFTMNAKQAVRDVRWHDENTVMYVTHSGSLQLIDVRSGKVVYDVIDPFQSTLYCVKSDGGNAILVGSSEYSRCVLFDIRNCTSHKQIFFTQKKSSPIYCLDFDATKLIAAADRSVAVLNFNVNVSKVELRDYSHAFEIVNR